MKKKNPPRKTKNKKKTATAPKKRERGAGMLAGKGRYILGLAAVALLVRFAGFPVVELIKAHPVFTLRNVVVEGACYIDGEEIIQTARLEKGKNIFEIDLSVISEGLKKEFTVENFTVYRRLPDTIAIKVDERQPVAIMNMKTLVGVDAEGVPLPHVGAVLVETLPIITGIETVASLSDSVVKARLMTGIHLINRISREAPTVYQRISEVKVANISETGITLIDNGVDIIIGADNWAQKIPNLERVIHSLSNRVEAVKSVDIRFGEMIFVRKE